MRFVSWKRRTIHRYACTNDSISSDNRYGFRGYLRASAERNFQVPFRQRAKSQFRVLALNNGGTYRPPNGRHGPVVKLASQA